MPLVVKDFEWSETEEAVTVQVPLNGVPTKRVDIYGTCFSLAQCINIDSK